MGLGMFGEPGANQQIAPVGPGQSNGVIYFVHPAIAEFQGSTLDSLGKFRRCIVWPCQRCTTIFLQEAPYLVLLAGRKTTHDVVLY